MQSTSFQTSQTLVKTDKYNASSFGLKFKQQKAQLQQVFNQMTNEYCTKISAQYINQKLSQNWLKGAKDHAKQRRIRSNRLAPKSAVPQEISRKTGQLQKFTPDSIQRI